MEEANNLSLLKDLIKILGPALMVSGIVYFMINSYYKQNRLLKNMEFRKSALNSSRDLKIQAYERLILMIERIEPVNLFLRLNTATSTVGQMTKSILIASQHEFDHNLSQQLYVSNNLWAIIERAKIMTIEMVSKASEKLDYDQDAEKLLSRLNELKSQGIDPFTNVKQAIKEEFSKVVGS